MQTFYSFHFDAESAVQEKLKTKKNREESDRFNKALVLKLQVSGLHPRIELVVVKALEMYFF